MIQVSFKFEVRILPMLAVEIEKSINNCLLNNHQLDHSFDVLIGIEYRGRGSVWFDLPLVLPVEMINHIIGIVFSEFRQRQLIPGGI